MYLNTRIISHHNKLEEDSFELFSTEKTALRISNVHRNHFTISIENIKDLPEERFISYAHEILSVYLVSLNIASLGHFSWDFQLVSPVPYFKSEELGELEDFLFLHKTSTYEFDDEPLEFHKDFAWRSLKIMIALGREKDIIFINEYIKGVFNFHNSFLNLNFKNEAFSNFYRAFEYFCTVKLLKVKNLDNEKKQLKSVLKDFGFDEETLDEFDKIYRARCNEIMHAQKGLKSEVELDLIVKLKIFLDSILHTYYEPIWNPKAT